MAWSLKSAMLLRPKVRTRRTRCNGIENGYHRSGFATPQAFRGAGGPLSDCGETYRSWRHSRKRRPRIKKSARKDLIHLARQFLETFQAACARLFRDAPTLKTYLVQCLHNRRPV